MLLRNGTLPEAGASRAGKEKLVCGSANKCVYPFLLTIDSDADYD
jgi:hypothetical protein